MAVATTRGKSPSSAFAPAAECLISANARMKARGMRRPVGGKFSTARCVWAPHNALAGTSSDPKLSRSTRVVAVIAPYSAVYGRILGFYHSSDASFPMASLFTDALSPLDGRYADKLSAVRRIFSEAGLMRERVRVECAWFLQLASGPAASALAELPIGARQFLAALSADPGATNVAGIKEIESRTNHDVKAVEYWLRGELQARGANPAQLGWIHFGCTSEDINNLAYAIMLKSARAALLLPKLGALQGLLDALAARHA